jgi:hypothetical protein
MANQINVTDSVIYVELSGNAVFVTDSVIYIELNSSELRVTDSVIYIEIEELPDRFELVYHGFNFPLSQCVVKYSLSQSDVTNLLSTAKERIPILPDWAIEITGFWSRDIANKVGNLSNQIGRSITLHVTDRYNETVDISNNEAFIANFITDINIDNALIYKITFVGSGVLNTL